MATEPQERDDDQWLDALAGKTKPAASGGPEDQTDLLRKALRARRARLEEEVPRADSALYEQVRFKLRREGLDVQRPFWRTQSAWGIAASLVLGVAVVFQLAGPFNRDAEQDTLRGGTDATVLIVPDTEARLTELLGLLKAAGAEPTIKRTGDHNIILSAEATQAVLAALREQRIEPSVKDGQVTLILKPAAAKR